MVPQLQQTDRSWPGRRKWGGFAQCNANIRSSRSHIRQASVLASILWYGSRGALWPECENQRVPPPLSCNMHSSWCVASLWHNQDLGAYLGMVLGGAHRKVQALGGQSRGLLDSAWSLVGLCGHYRKVWDWMRKKAWASEVENLALYSIPSDSNV